MIVIGLNSPLYLNFGSTVGKDNSRWQQVSIESYWMPQIKAKVRCYWPCSLGGIWRNLDDYREICERVISVFQSGTVNFD